MDQQRLNDEIHGGSINGEERRLLGSLSNQEHKILDELEAEIERNLEEEIKDGIYNLTLKLHRLYQQRRERDASVGSSKTLSEVNISIKMEGATKIEIKETKKEANRQKRAEGGKTKTPESFNKSLGLDKKNKFHGTCRTMKNQLKVRELGWKW